MHISIQSISTKPLSKLNENRVWWALTFYEIYTILCSICPRGILCYAIYIDLASIYNLARNCNENRLCSPTTVHSNSYLLVPGTIQYTLYSTACCFPPLGRNELHIFIATRLIFKLQRKDRCKYTKHTNYPITM